MAEVASCRQLQCRGKEQDSQTHIAWVTEALKRMQTIKSGMTRKTLLTVFTTEGGLLFDELKRTFVSQDCPFFKVDVEFRAVGGRIVMRHLSKVKRMSSSRSHGRTCSSVFWTDAEKR